MYFKLRVIVDWIKKKKFSGKLILILHCNEGGITGIDKYIPK